ncbi:hypothetical protein PRIPAC_72013 [Pristionchus pacificus]|uniref:Histone deacetylase n=1 Tax=Pristionchus pacificus TaxID=54126 RepID=A0A2A6C7M1_PRIPA|nr:hypothetical protein PRIPAC_72013 [Pristionchus pacificus]|eukprot:PDM74205.1 hypothetical protein PRIPAC_41561 [Pristionchus pacificus]
MMPGRKGSKSCSPSADDDELDRSFAAPSTSRVIMTNARRLRMSAAARSTQGHSKNRVTYYYNADIANCYYGEGHVMKPHRIRMAHQLIMGYGLYQHLQVYRPWPASAEEMARFHTNEYVDFLQRAAPDTLRAQYSKASLDRFNINNDCPVFHGLFNFCSLSTGGSLAGAVKLNKKQTDIAINWMGGLHHAKKSEASGFCYTNDIVLGILELLKYHKRVLYVDIDVHHGDGVEEAFYTTDRVMTVSFHRYGNFFPRTGHIKDIGAYAGHRYALNVPLKEGITDDAYQSIFQPILASVMERYRPNAIVLQCGADSLVGDKLGTFNLTLNGHGDCVKFLRSYNVPLMLLGGGGYTPRNVARCWTYETAIALDRDLDDQLPFTDYLEYFSPDYTLHIAPSARPDDNSRKYLNRIKEEVLGNLAALPAAPSVQMQPIPADALNCLSDAGARRDAASPDDRLHSSIMDDVTVDQGEFYDGEEEEAEGGDCRNEHCATENRSSGSDADDEL